MVCCTTFASLKFLSEQSRKTTSNIQKRFIVIFRKNENGNQLITSINYNQWLLVIITIHYCNVNNFITSLHLSTLQSIQLFNKNYLIASYTCMI